MTFGPLRVWSLRIYQAFMDLIILIAPIGLFYFSAARVLIWFFFAISLISVFRKPVDLWLVRNAVIYIAALFLGALLALYPDLAIGGVLRIAMGFCMFVPGVVIGRRLRDRPIGIISLLPVLMLGVAQLFAPQDYHGRFYYGFHDNPNSAGHGMAFALLILGVAYTSVRDHPKVGRVSGGLWCYRLAWTFTILVHTGLLIISNYRAGWLGVFLFGLVLVLWESSIPANLRFWIGVALTAGAAILIRFKDDKGLGLVGSIGERMAMWERSLIAWWQHFSLFGSGFRSFHVMGAYYVGGIVGRSYRYPHNIAVELLFSSGIYGFVLTIVYAVVQSFGLLKAGLCFDRLLPKAGLLAIVSMMVMGQFGMQFASFEYVGALSCLFGILTAQLPVALQYGVVPRSSSTN